MSRHLAAALCAAVLSTGCFDIFNTNATTNPDPSIHLLGGVWRSTTTDSTTLLTGCTNFTWNATEPASGSVVGAGAFTATCFGTVQVSGTARATQSGSVVNWTASGVANGGAVSNCAISLTGTATQNGDDLVIYYEGSTCLGAVSGTEILRRS
jgi:hypothetical protein